WISLPSGVAPRWLALAAPLPQCPPPSPGYLRVEPVPSRIRFHRTPTERDLSSKAVLEARERGRDRRTADDVERGLWRRTASTERRHEVRGCGRRWSSSFRNGGWLPNAQSQRSLAVAGALSTGRCSCTASWRSGSPTPRTRR